MLPCDRFWLPITASCKTSPRDASSASIQQKQRSTPTSRQPLDKHCVAVAAKRDSSDPMDVDSIWKYCGKKCGQKEEDRKARIMATAKAARKAQQVRFTVPVPVRIC